MKEGVFGADVMRFMVSLPAVRLPVLNRGWVGTVIGRREVGPVRLRVLWFGGSACSCGCPCALGATSKAEGCQAGQVVGGGEQVEVGGDFGPSSHSCSSPAVASSHQVSELAFDLGSGGPVVGDPLGVLRLGAGFGQDRLMAADVDSAAGVCGGAVGSQRAVGTGRFEVGRAVAGWAAADGDLLASGAGVGLSTWIGPTVLICSGPTWWGCGVSSLGFGQSGLRGVRLMAVRPR